MLNIISPSQIEHANQAMDIVEFFVVWQTLCWSVFSFLGTINFSVGDAMAPRQEGGTENIDLAANICISHKAPGTQPLSRHVHPAGQKHISHLLLLLIVLPIGPYSIRTPTLILVSGFQLEHEFLSMQKSTLCLLFGKHSFGKTFCS